MVLWLYTYICFYRSMRCSKPPCLGITRVPSINFSLLLFFYLFFLSLFTFSSLSSSLLSLSSSLLFLSLLLFLGLTYMSSCNVSLYVRENPRAFVSTSVSRCQLAWHRAPTSRTYSIKISQRYVGSGPTTYIREATEPHIGFSDPSQATETDRFFETDKTRQLVRDPEKYLWLAVAVDRWEI